MADFYRIDDSNIILVVTVLMGSTLIMLAAKLDCLQIVKACLYLMAGSILYNPLVIGLLHFGLIDYSHDGAGRWFSVIIPGALMGMACIVGLIARYKTGKNGSDNNVDR